MRVEPAASVPAPVHRLLVWYESTRLVRVLVRHLPYGAGSAVDLALVAVLGLIGSHPISPAKGSLPERPA